MSQCQFVVVLIVEDVEEVAVEGVDVFDFREVVQNVEEAFVDGVLAELDLGWWEGVLCACRRSGCGRWRSRGVRRWEFSFGFWRGRC